MSSSLYAANTQMCVYVLGTYHVEDGNVTVASLLAILERFQPDVIFAESCASEIDSYKDGSHGGLESLAVSRWLQTHSLDVIPVDLPRPDSQFLYDAKELFGRIERYGPAYRQLVDFEAVNRREGGFIYLNSDTCIDSWTDISRETLDMVNWLRDPRLSECYERWNRTIEERDVAILENIELYLARKPVAKGLLLVGAAHRKSIQEKTLAKSDTPASAIEWRVRDLPIDTL